ncbi:MAG: hypothetical protein WA397_08840, partial [Roseiarcus sp.]
MRPGAGYVAQSRASNRAGAGASSDRSRGNDGAAAHEWHVSCEAGRNKRVGWRMDNFLQQLINGLTLGSIYGL